MLLGATITGCGVWLVFGLGWGVIVVGVVVMVLAVLGIDSPAARRRAAPPGRGCRRPR